MATDCQVRCQNRLERFLALCLSMWLTICCKVHFPLDFLPYQTFNPLIYPSIFQPHQCPSMVSLPSLSRIYLAGCGFKGRMPEVLTQMKSWTFLSWLGGLSQLYLLNLPRNSLVSSIPETLVSLKDFGVLYLHWNHLKGSIDQIYQIGSKFYGDSLTSIDLSDNKFSRGI